MKTNEMGIATQALDLTGQRFGSLTYVRPVTRMESAIKWVAVCDCGRVTKVDTCKRRKTKSCGDDCPTHCKQSFAALSGRYRCEKHGEQKSRSQGTRKRCSLCVNAIQQEIRQRLKQQAVDHLGGCCVRCGYNKCIAALDFHHRDPAEKDFNIGSHRGIWESIKGEVEKCDLLCSNCHREHHYNEGLTDE